jgi:hypothetical protein
MNALKIVESAEGIPILARLGVPPVATCFDCDCPVPVASTHWCGELSERGRVVALLPYCEPCLSRRVNP